LPISIASAVEAKLVDQDRAARLQFGAKLLRADRLGRAHVDNDGARLQRRGERAAIRVQDDAADDRARREHEHDDVLRADLGERPGASSRFLRPGREARGVSIVGDDLVPGLSDIRGHRATHVADTDESDPHLTPPSSRDRVP
jgi:hypothetical protein